MKLFRKRKIAIIALTILIFAELLILSEEYKFPYLLNAENYETQKMLQECDNKSNTKTFCYAKKFSQLTTKTDIEFSKRILWRLQGVDPTLIDCHLISHFISSAEVAKDPSKWKIVMEEQDPNMCLGGYVHGILEEYLRESHKGSITASTVENICNIFQANERKVSSCYHMMGHFLLLQEKGNVDSAVAICDALPVQHISYGCYYGIFMENNTKLALLEHGIISELPELSVRNVKELEDYCSVLNRETAVLACWGEMGRTYMNFFKNDTAKALGGCSSAILEEYVSQCKNFVVLQSMLLKSKIAPADLKELCQDQRELTEGWKKCIMTLESSLLSENIQNATNLINLCEILDASFNNSCYLTIVYYLIDSNLPKAQIDTICAKLPADFTRRCKTY